MIPCICYSDIRLKFIMNENDGTMEFEYTTNEGFGDVMLEPGFSGTAPYDCPRSYDNSELYSNSRPHDGSGPSDGSGQDYYSETNDLESKEKTEPLFVIDKTKNFRLNRTIQYEVIQIYFSTGLYLTWVIFQLHIMYIIFIRYRGETTNQFFVHQISDYVYFHIFLHVLLSTSISKYFHLPTCTSKYFQHVIHNS